MGILSYRWSKINDSLNTKITKEVSYVKVQTKKRLNKIIKVSLVIKSENKFRNNKLHSFVMSFYLFGMEKELIQIIYLS